MATILLVEDTPANRALASKLLQAAGHEVLSAETATDGIALARERLPDLVLMDLGLPDMDGWQALSELRRDQGAAAKLRIVAFTAHAMLGDRDRALAAGFDEYLSKPIDFATFVDTIREPAAMRRERPLILAVDDEAGTRVLLRKLLERQGYDVVEAVDGESALRVVDEQIPDLVCLDVMMPGSRWHRGV